MMGFGKGGRRWAPEVHKIGDKYVAYMSIGFGKTGRIRIYVASSDHPVHGWSHPRAIASSKKWNNIDPTFYHDDETNKNYLLYKEDRTTRQGRKRIEMVQLDGTGTHLAKHHRKHTLLVAGVGEHSELERRPKPRNANWSVEAPTLEKHGDRYWLFYSGAGYEVGGGYFVGVASSTKITGPFHREAHPLLRGGSGTMHEPGHQSIIRIVVGGVVRWLMFFHARDAHGKARYLREDQIVWVNGKPQIKQI
jgi:beta-xylosidase